MAQTAEFYVLAIHPLQAKPLHKCWHKQQCHRERDGEIDDDHCDKILQT